MPHDCSVKTRIQTDVAATKIDSAKSALASSAVRPASASSVAAVKKAGGARKMFMRILKEQGIAGLYRGFGASMLNTFSMQLYVLSSA